MTSDQAIVIASGLATFFDRKVWSAEKIRFFAQAIEDLDYDATSQAATEFMREARFPPVPKDIREIAQRIASARPQRALLPHDPGEGEVSYPPGHYVRCTASERQRLQGQYDRMRRETKAALEGRKESALRREMNDILARVRDEEVPF